MAKKKNLDVPRYFVTFRCVHCLTERTFVFTEFSVKTEEEAVAAARREGNLGEVWEHVSTERREK